MANNLGSDEEDPEFQVHMHTCVCVCVYMCGGVVWA